MENPSKPCHGHIAILTSPGIGHTIPIIALGEQILSLLHGFQVTIFITNSHSSTAQAELLQSQSMNEGFQIIQLPTTDISELVSKDSSGIETTISLTVSESIRVLKSAILALEHRPTVLIVDIFGTDAFELADELGMLKYVFITTAMFTALTLYLQTIDKEIKGEYVDQKEPIQVPVCKPIQIEYLIDPMMDRQNDQYSSMLYQASRYPMADGILINTLGPLTRVGEGPAISGDKNTCLDWLNKQPSGSVIFVSFGSGGTLTADQITELAWGLEKSQQRFLWVVRAPTVKETFGTFFTSGSGGGKPSDYLPEGFLNRTLEVGLVVPSWCPQLEILRHESVGACLSHSWPLFAEQRLNASLLVEDIKVAIRPNIWSTKELIGRTEIEKMIRMLMEKKDAENPWRVRAKEMKEQCIESFG
ncbi:hypothetical protein MKX01_038977 [Papaver californicum]|nr:hypothetical protein MKX01_038977 [Papaver californicum]